MAGDTDTQMAQNQVGAYTLLRRHARAAPGSGRVYSARHNETAEHYLMVRPPPGADWTPQEDWEVHMRSCANPPCVLVKVAVPPQTAVPFETLSTTYDVVTEALEGVEQRPEVAAHLGWLPSPPQHRPRRQLQHATPESAAPEHAASALHAAHAPAMQDGEAPPQLSVVGIAPPESAAAGAVPPPLSVVGTAPPQSVAALVTPAEASSLGAPTAAAHVVASGVRTLEPASVDLSSSRPARRVALHAWRPWWAALACAVLTALVLAPGILGRTVPAPEPGTCGAALAGLAEEVLTEPELLPAESLDEQVQRLSFVGLEMPPRPFKGQRLAPCKSRAATEIQLSDGSRSCWIAIKVTSEVCKEEGYEWKGGCYLPSIPSAREPGSITPR